MGYTRDCFHCPYAVFLQKEYDMNVTVCKETFVLLHADGTELEYALPDWARWFAGRVDKWGGVGGSMPVPAAIALALLESLLGELDVDASTPPQKGVPLWLTR